MKRILSLILVAVLCLGVLTGCAVVDTVKGWFDKTPDEPEVTYHLDKAVEYVNTLYRADSEITGADYELVSKVAVKGVMYTVDWSVDNELVKAVKGEKVWTIDVPDEAEADISYKLTATITAGDGTTATVSFDRKVPAFAVNSWAEYMAAKEGDNLVVEGIVVAMSSKSTGGKRNHIFLMDKTGVGGYYNYDMEKDPVADLGIEVGMTVRITGPAAPYSGMMEIKKGVATIIDSNKVAVTPIDITDKFVKDANFGNFTALPVVIKGVTIGGQDLADANHQYLHFTVNGVESYVRTYVTDFPSTLVAADKATIDALHASKQGYNADVTGILVLFGEKAPYIIPTSVDCFYNITLPQRTDAEKLELEIGGVNVPTDIAKDTVLELPLAGVTYPDVKFAWSVDNTAYTIGADGKVEIKLGASAVTLKFTLTATLGENTPVTKEYTVKVAPNFVMSETHAYVPYINIGTYGDPLYLDGGVSDRYLTTTTDVSNAVAVYAEKAEGGYKLYILKDGVKNYITIYLNSSNKDSVKYDPAGTTVYAYNPTLNAFVTNLNGADKYLGTYLDKNNKPYSTISVSNLSYLTTENTGVSQFPLELLPVAEGTELNASFTQAKPTEKTYYLNGGVSDRYLTTTEILSEAVAVYAEKVEGGYKFYILVDGVKNYITIYSNSDNKDSVKYDPNGNTVFTYKADVNAWATTFNGVDKYLGTYYYEKNNSTYSTVSVSNLSYITSENTGVTQYPLTYSIPAHVCDFAAATCTKPATCSCGAVQEGSTALGHNKVDGECANCHAKYVTLTEAAALADNTLVFVEVTVSKITFAWSDSSKNMSVDVTDGTTTLNAYKLGSKVGAGDVIVIYGKVSSYNNVKQIAEGATAEIKTAHVCSTYTDGKCPVCGAKEPVANLAKATSVAVGDTVYIVCETAKAEMNAFSTTSTIYGTHVEYTGAVTGAYAWTLVAGATDGTFAFKNADGKYMTWKSGNSLVLSDTVDANSSWTITFEDGNAIITNSADTTRNLRWNASAPRFATYTSAQTMIQLYK